MVLAGTRGVQFLESHLGPESLAILPAFSMDGTGWSGKEVQGGIQRPSFVDRAVFEI